MDKREQIERALGRYHQSVFSRHGHVLFLDVDTIAESKDVIAIECEVEHSMIEGYLPGGNLAVTELRVEDDGDLVHYLRYANHIGTPGKALAIIVSLEEDDDSIQPRDAD